MRLPCLLLAAAVGRAEAWAPAHPQLLTRWAADVSPTHVKPEHPRPDAWRGEGSWQSLNGLWEADGSPADLSAPPFAGAMPQQILVPFPFEAALSGIRMLPKHHYMWYRRNLTVPAAKLSGGGRVLLKFEAVDWHSELWINKKHIGNHSGGYDGFEFDITDALDGEGGASLVLGVFDPTEAGNQPHGKQSMGVFAATKASSKYTSTSGIWATVWLEFVPSTYIADLHIVSTVAESSATVSVEASLGGSAAPAGCSVQVALLDGSSTAGHATGPAATPIAVHLSTMPKLWSPASPFLHNLTATLSCGGKAIDVLNSYVGIRQIELKRVQTPQSEGCAYTPGADTLPGYPRKMDSAAACAAACTAPSCAAWTFSATALPPPPSPPPTPPGPSPGKPGASGVGVDLHGGDLPGMPIHLNGSAAANVTAQAKACEALCAARHSYGAPAERCDAWVISVPGCKSPGHSSWPFAACFLKAGGQTPKSIKNPCRVSGRIGGPDAAPASLISAGDLDMCSLHATLPPPPIIHANGSSCGHWATKLMLNNKPAPFLAGVSAATASLGLGLTAASDGRSLLQQILSQGFWPSALPPRHLPFGLCALKPHGDRSCVSPGMASTRARATKRMCTSWSRISRWASTTSSVSW